jgi:PEGA domain
VILVGITLSGGAIQALAGRFRPRADAEASALIALTPDRAGYLQVVVDPWAEVHLDGRLLTVTPSAERFMLAPGAHFVKFVHPQFQPVTREVQIERGQVFTLRVALSEPLPALGSAK